MIKSLNCFIIFICFCYSALGQAPSNVAKDTNEVFQYAEVQPEFPGGMAAFVTFLQDNIRYPILEKENGIQGKVYVSFIIEKNGSISNTSILRGVPNGPGLEMEAIRVIQMMPKWTPGKMNGKPVRCSFKLPIKFALSDPNLPTSTTPSFPEGKTPAEKQVSFDKYVSSNVKYPPKALKKKKEGAVIISFTVDPSGNCSDQKIVSSTNKIFNEEALRLVKTITNWTPDKDQKTNYAQTVTVNFKIPK